MYGPPWRQRHVCSRMPRLQLPSWVSFCALAACTACDVDAIAMSHLIVEKKVPHLWCQVEVAHKQTYEHVKLAGDFMRLRSGWISQLDPASMEAQSTPDLQDTRIDTIRSFSWCMKPSRGANAARDDESWALKQPPRTAFILQGTYKPVWIDAIHP